MNWIFIVVVVVVVALFVFSLLYTDTIVFVFPRIVKFEMSFNPWAVRYHDILFTSFIQNNTKIICITLTFASFSLSLSIFTIVTVTRLIRIAYGDYELQSIPPGLAIQVPWKPVDRQKAKGKLFSKTSNQKRQTRRKRTDAAPITWVQGFQS